MNHFEQFQFDATACRLNVARGPANGPHLILLHGTTSWWHSWDPVLEPLSSKYHVHALDLRGSGMSDRTPGRYSVMDMTHDVADYIDSLDGPAHIIGHSFGGHIGLALSARRTDNILSLTLEDTPLTIMRGKLVARPAGPGFVAWLKILARKPTPETIQNVVQRIDAHLTPERQTLRATCLGLLDPEVLEVYVNGEPFAGYEPETLFARLGIPTLLVEADPEIDTRMDPGAAAHAASLSPDVRRASIKGAGHNVHDQDPDGFVAAVAPFLAKAG